MWGKESRQLQRLSVFALKHPSSILLPPWSPCRVTVIGLPVALDKGHTFCAHSPLCCHVSPSYLRGLGFAGASGVFHKQPNLPKHCVLVHWGYNKAQHLEYLLHNRHLLLILVETGKSMVKIVAHYLFHEGLLTDSFHCVLT